MASAGRAGRQSTFSMARGPGGQPGGEAPAENMRGRVGSLVLHSSVTDRISKNGSPCYASPISGDKSGQVMRTMAVCAALIFGASLAHADPAEDCNQVHNSDLQLRGCTAYIRLGKGSPENLRSEERREGKERRSSRR